MHILGMHAVQKGVAVSVRQSLLAILDQGSCYGYQLRAEFERRTGGATRLNVGQIYNTLDRLDRDGLVRKGAADPQGHIHFEITDAGRAEVREWLSSPVARSGGTRDELALKIALAATLPGADAPAIVRAERTASRSRLERLRAEAATADPDRREGFAASVVATAMIAAAEAEVRWLGEVDAMLAAQPGHALALGLSAERPRRGRPAAGAS
jgi:DNA-binding PadR family transcriptional regulator